MAGIDDKTFKFSIRDIIFAAAFIATAALNYATVSHNQVDSELRQDKVNAINDIQLKTLDLRVSALEVIFRDIQKPKQK